MLMPNSMKKSGGSDSLALQVTAPVRDANLVEEADSEQIPDTDTPPHPTYRANVRIHAFDGVLLVIDRDRVNPEAEAELVAHAIDQTRTAFRALHGIVTIMGQGYMLQLPNAVDAGFDAGQLAPVQTAPNLLAIHTDTADALHLATDLVTIRLQQLAD